MTDPIQHLRERMAKASMPPNEATAELINALPALLAVAEAARAYMRHKFPNGDQSSMVTFSMQMPGLADDLLDALAKLDEVKP